MPYSSDFIKCKMTTKFNLNAISMNVSKENLGERRIGNGWLSNNFPCLEKIFLRQNYPN